MISVTEVATKTCTLCAVERPLSEYYFRESRGHHHASCKACQRAQARKWKLDNPERQAAQYLAWQRKNMDRCTKSTEAWRRKYPERQALNARRYSLRKFGITPDIYDTMLAQQQFCCAICNSHQTEFKRRFAVDHDHKTGKVRALLCDNCNKGIGCLKESPAVLEAAISYIKKHRDAS